MLSPMALTRSVENETHWSCVDAKSSTETKFSKHMQEVDTSVLGVVVSPQLPCEILSASFSRSVDFPCLLLDDLLSFESTFVNFKSVLVNFRQL